MNKILMIGGCVAAVGAAMTLLWHRLAAPPARYAWLRRSGWDAYPRSGRAVLSRLNSLALLQVGHNQRCRTILQPAGRELLAVYEFETGAEHHRALHEWTIAAHESERRLPRAVMTRQDWIAAVATSPVAHVFFLLDGDASRGQRAADRGQQDSSDGHLVPRGDIESEAASAQVRVLRGPAKDAAAAREPWTLIVEDPEGWPDQLRRSLGDWLAPQPADRTWEILPDAIVGYQPAGRKPAATTELLEASRQLTRELAERSEQQR